MNKNIIIIALIIVLGFLVLPKLKFDSSKFGNRHNSRSFEKACETVGKGSYNDAQKVLSKIGDINMTSEYTDVLLGGQRTMNLLSCASLHTNNPEIIKLIIDKGINKYAPSETSEKSDNYLLMAAEYNQNTGIITALFDNGIVPPYDDYAAVLEAALKNPNPKITSEALSNYKVRAYAYNSDGGLGNARFLVMAAESDDAPEQKVQYLVDNGFDVNMQYGLDDFMRFLAAEGIDTEEFTKRPSYRLYKSYKMNVYELEKARVDRHRSSEKTVRILEKYVR